MSVKILGILGLGNRSTLFYLDQLNTRYNKSNGGYSTCPFKLLNANFDHINNLLPNTSVTLNGIVKHYLNELNTMNVTYAIVPNITLHETIDQLTFETNLIHPVDCCIKEIEKKAQKKVVLFGSLHTMKSDYICSKFKARGIDVQTPTREEMFFIDNLRKLIYQKKESKEQLIAFHTLIDKYTHGLPVVLACTELSIAATTINKSNLFDMAKIQIEYALIN